MQCQKCGGQILRNLDEYFCLQCSAEHDEAGNICVPRWGRRLETLYDGRAGDKYNGGVKQPVIYRRTFPWGRPRIAGQSSA
jgi:hypothetical protein